MPAASRGYKAKNHVTNAGLKSSKGQFNPFIQEPPIGDVFVSTALLAIAATDVTIKPSAKKNGSLEVRAIISAHRQLADVIESLTDEQYVQKPVGVIPSSIGGHVRHCLDHVEALLSAATSGDLNYEHRQRGTSMEFSRETALACIDQQEQRLKALADIPNSRRLRMTVRVTSSDPTIEVVTSLGRELSFVLSHTIHHSALISAMVAMLGGSVPDRFGYAPSTIAYLERQQCAP
jgi:uncharacterized damage-inducible protein DinB